MPAFSAGGGGSLDDRSDLFMFNKNDYPYKQNSYKYQALRSSKTTPFSMQHNDAFFVVHLVWCPFGPVKVHYGHATCTL